MDSKQKMIFAAGGILCGLIIVVLAVFLVIEFGAMGAAKENRNQAEASLTGYYDEKPYPSEANRKLRLADVKVYDDWSTKVRTLLTHSLDVTEETPSQFVDRLNRTVRSLNERTDGASSFVDLSKNRDSKADTAMDYSFGRYVTQGEMPKEADVPRLSRQFAIIAYISNLLLDKGAISISEVSREAFDRGQVKTEEAPRRSSRRRRTVEETAPVVAGETEIAPALKKDGVTCESFTLKFRARYNTVAQMLNALAQDELFIVVTDVSIVNPVSLKERVLEMGKKREAARTTVRNRAAKRGEAVREEEEAALGLFENATATERLVTDPARGAPLEVILKIDVYSAPAPATVEPAATKEGE
ncbi:MAG: Amuc_1100 family pilus-like protein [Kiritimatiellia bacterium]